MKKRACGNVGHSKVHRRLDAPKIYPEVLDNFVSVWVVVAGEGLGRPDLAGF